ELAVFFGPAVFHRLLAAGDRETILGHVAGDDAARRDIGTIAHRHRCYERGIRSDKDVGPNLGVMLLKAVIVAGDGAGADIAARPHARIADIGEMIDLGALADPRLLHFDEITDMGIVTDLGPGPQPCEGTDAHAVGDFGTFDMREAHDLDIVANDDVRADD